MLAKYILEYSSLRLYLLSDIGMNLKYARARETFLMTIERNLFARLFNVVMVVRLDL